MKNKNQKLVDDIQTQYHLQNKFVVIFLGRIAPEKSIEILIDAMQDIVKINQKICLMIVGGGPQLEELKTIVQQKKLQDFIFFTGPKESIYVPHFIMLHSYLYQLL